MSLPGKEQCEAPFGTHLLTNTPPSLHDEQILDGSDLETGLPTEDPTNDIDDDSEVSMVEHDVADTSIPHNDIPTPQDSTTEDSTLDAFLTEGCKCRLAANGQCCSLFPREHYTSMRNNCAEMNRTELDMAVLGQLSAFTNSSSNTVTTSYHSSKSRKRSYCQLDHHE